MNTITVYFVNVKPQPRGAYHGYTATDYANDVAAEINKKICDQVIGTSQRQVEDLLAEYTNAIGFDLLFIDSEQVELDD